MGIGERTAVMWAFGFQA